MTDFQYFPYILLVHERLKWAYIPSLTLIYTIGLYLHLDCFMCLHFHCIISLDILFFSHNKIKMPCKCVNRADSFCYVCGKVTFALQKRALTQIVKTAYHLYFGCKVGDQDKS